jgi:hypothetical protein
MEECRGKKELTRQFTSENKVLPSLQTSRSHHNGYRDALFKATTLKHFSLLQ